MLSDLQYVQTAAFNQLVPDGHRTLAALTYRFRTKCHAFSNHRFVSTAELSACCPSARLGAFTVLRHCLHVSTLLSYQGRCDLDVDNVFVHRVPKQPGAQAPQAIAQATELQQAILRLDPRAFESHTAGNASVKHAETAVVAAGVQCLSLLFRTTQATSCTLSRRNLQLYWSCHCYCEPDYWYIRQHKPCKS